MMTCHKFFHISAAIAAALLLSSFQAASAGTIIKLDLGDDNAHDIEFSGGFLSTLNDGNPAPHGITIGEQTTTVEYLGSLSSFATVVGGSYTLNGLEAIGNPITFTIGGVTHVGQDFQGGSFQIYDDNDVKLLDVALAGSALVGPIGGPRTAAAFSTTDALVVGGTLQGQIPDIISMSISMTDVRSNNGQGGLRLTAGGALRPFTADATKLMAVVPEPTAALLVMLGACIGLPALMRRRSS